MNTMKRAGDEVVMELGAIYASFTVLRERLAILNDHIDSGAAATADRTKGYVGRALSLAFALEHSLTAAVSCQPLQSDHAWLARAQTAWLRTGRRSFEDACMPKEKAMVEIIETYTTCVSSICVQPALSNTAWPETTLERHIN